MSRSSDTLLDLVDELSKRLPGLELLKLLTSETEEEFDEVIEGVLERAVDHLEKNATHLAELNEEAISAFLVAYLNMPGFLHALQEAHCNGHVDITIEAGCPHSLIRRLGEAKIYDGPAYHIQGLEQLICRYVTGRERSVFIVEYVKQAKISELVKKVRSHLDLTKPCQQNGESSDHRIRWSFTTNHKHSSGEILRVLHLNCNLHRPSN